MGCLLWLYQNQLVNLIFILSFIQVTCLQAQPCPHDQRFALLHFKKHFSFNKSASSYCDDFGIPSDQKLESWKEGTNCCSWDGVECDRGTGHVIGLDLSCSWLSGTIHPNSTLFLFSRLQKLNLAFNDFKNSSISSTFSRFTRLTHLNLSASRFYGQISSEISLLSKLTSLDLSWNYNLRLKNPGFQLLVQNLTKLRDLNLDRVNISSAVPNSLFNLTSLTSLSLASCGLQEKFPDDIFHQPNLKKLVLWDNYDLTGHFPKFNSSSPLQYLDLFNTGFSGELPHSIGNLKSLNTLYVDYCKFSGSIPTSLGNLTQITILGLSGNTFNGSIAPVIPYLKNLRFLFLGGNNISDPFLPLASNLTKLVAFYVWDTQVASPLPSHVSGLSNLDSLSLCNCSVSGTIPSWLFTLPSLRGVSLTYNKFNGCINDFQSNSLESIDLSNNKLRGTIPRSIFQRVNLTSLDLSSNNLSGTIEKLPWKYIIYLNLQSNLLEGPLPVPPPSTTVFLISNNKLTGDIPSLVCNASILQVLDLSDNNLSGVIPQCLGNFSKDLSVLDLRKNGFHGTIPNTFTKGNRLSTIAFNGNELEGQIPKSLVNCKELEVLDLGNNKLSDTFPHWLEKFSKLHVLILRSNRFHGLIATSKANFFFPNLRVIDISYNDFSGPLPTKYFKSFKAMRNVDETKFKLEYMGVNYYVNSMTLTMKGSIFEMEKVLTTFIVIDFSKNKFEGEIPLLIGNLNGIGGLNLSHNKLSGQIPTSFGNLRNLEWLDLSSNMLIGEIPQQLTSLTFLAVFNVSNNQLTGVISQGNQFNTFSNDSYSGNCGLCGLPLSKKCNNFEPPQPPMILDELESTIEFDWKVISMGYGCGLVFGLSMGYLMFSIGKPKWLVRIIEDKQHKSKKRSKKHATSHRCRRN